MMLRSPLAIIGGLISGWVAWGALFALLYFVGHRVSPEEFPWPLPPPAQTRPPTGVGWLAATLAIDGIVAVVTGFVLALIARKSVINHAFIAVAIMTVGAVMTALGEQDKLPAWVSWGRIALMPPGVLLGAWLRGDKALAGDNKAAEDQEPANGVGT
jgi:hypothetical protein